MKAVIPLPPTITVELTGTEAVLLRLIHAKMSDFHMRGLIGDSTIARCCLDVSSSLFLVLNDAMVPSYGSFSAEAVKSYLHENPHFQAMSPVP